MIQSLLIAWSVVDVMSVLHCIVIKGMLTCKSLGELSNTNVIPKTF